MQETMKDQCNEEGYGMQEMTKEQCVNMRDVKKKSIEVQFEVFIKICAVMSIIFGAAVFIRLFILRWKWDFRFLVEFADL